MSEKVKLPKLTGILNEIADVIGRDAALKLCAARGGTRAYIPSSVSNDHWLALTIGIENAKKLAGHYSSSHFSITANKIRKRGSQIVIPLGPRPPLPVGSASKVARELGVTERTVHRRRAREILAGGA